MKAEITDEELRIVPETLHERNELESWCRKNVRMSSEGSFFYRNTGNLTFDLSSRRFNQDDKD